MTELTAEIIQRGRGSDPASRAKRRKAMASVRATREKLLSSSGVERSFAHELIEIYLRQQHGAAIASFVLALLLGALGALWVPSQSLAVGLSLALCATGIIALLGRRFARLRADSVDTRLWRRRFVLAEAMRGIAWSLTIWSIIAIDTPGAKVCALFALLMICAVTTVLSAGIPAAVYASLGLACTALIGLVYPPKGFDSAGLAAMGACSLLFFLFLTHRLHRSTIASLGSRAEKDALFFELEEAKANSDEARRKAEEANLAKSRFLATMSHELRTPLNAILGFSEVLKNEMFGPHAQPSYKEYAGDIHGSGEHLLNLINEILDLSRIEAGRYELQEEAVDIAQIVEECRHMLAIKAKAKSQTVKEMVEPALPKLWADERAVRQIVLNLLSNAIKFTPQNGEITVKAGWTAAGGQYVSISDTGPGIPPDEIPTVLSSFGRGSLASKTAEQGSGLGLPIVKGLVDIHGGGFHLRSKPREGTEVIVTFPAARVMDALAAVPEQRPRYTSAA